jgi:hypothetical protein
VLCTTRQKAILTTKSIPRRRDSLLVVSFSSLHGLFLLDLAGIRLDESFLLLPPVIVGFFFLVAAVLGVDAASCVGSVEAAAATEERVLRHDQLPLFMKDQEVPMIAVMRAHWQ